MKAEEMDEAWRRLKHIRERQGKRRDREWAAKQNLVRANEIGNFVGKEMSFCNE